MKSRANKKNALSITRGMFKDSQIEFGARWDFVKNGKSFIVRMSDLMKGHKENFQTSLEGYDYTVNIKAVGQDLKLAIQKNS